MKSKIISAFLCILVLGATFYLIIKAPSETSEPETGAQSETLVTMDSVETEVTRTFVIETAHDAEDLMENLAYGKDKNFENTLSDLVTRLKRSADFLKNDLKDYYGATYFTKVSEIFQDTLENPFADSASFSERVSKKLTELQNAYPAPIAETLDENHPETPMYYPKFDTAANGKSALAFLAIYRQQYQKNNNCILLTFGGNAVLGDPLLDGEKENSFKTLYEKDKRYPLLHLSSVLLTDSLSLSNLEAPLTESIGDVTAAGSIKGIPGYASLLKEGGIDGVSIANTNILNYGETGKNDTKKALEDAGVSYSDEGKISYYETKLGKVAFLTYDIIDETRANANLTYSDAVKVDIAAAKENGAKIVITHFNWINTEKKAWDPSMSQIQTARAAVDSGANLVLGSHTGAIEGVERYKGVSIVYSNGDLLNRQSGNANTFLYQQAFSLDAEGNAVPGQIQLFPLAGSGSDTGYPTLILDSASVQSFREAIRSSSSTVRYGVGKKAEFTLDELNLISLL